MLTFYDFLLLFRLAFFLGVAGNTLIVAAVCGYRKMKSATNIFLASLAVADLLFCLICIPVKVSFVRLEFRFGIAFFLVAAGQAVLVLVDVGLLPLQVRHVLGERAGRLVGPQPDGHEHRKVGDTVHP